MCYRASTHFAVLQEADLIEAEKDGRIIYCRLKMSVLQEALLGFAAGFGIGDARGRNSTSRQGVLRRRDV